MKSLREAAEKVLNVFSKHSRWTDYGFKAEVAEALASLRSALAAEPAAKWFVQFRPQPEWQWSNRGCMGGYSTKESAERQLRQFVSKDDSVKWRIVRVCETVEPESEGGGK